MAGLESTTDYTDKFDPVWYLNIYYSTLEGQEEEEGFLLFVVEKIHQIFQSGVINGATLLDVGTGPSIHSVIEASDHVTEMYLSDFSEVNLKVLKNWWKSGEDMLPELCGYILDKIQSKKSVQEKQDEMRKKVKGVLPIDVTKDQPLGENPASKCIDVIMSSLCLEAASQTLDSYKTCARNVTSLLKSGGYLVLVGVLNQTFYRTGNFKFMCTKISATQLKDVYTELGYDIMQFDVMKIEREETAYSDCDSCFVMLAKKQ